MQDEAEVVTGHSDAEMAGQAILDRPGSLTQWCVIKLGPQGALLRTKNPAQTIKQPAIQVKLTHSHSETSSHQECHIQ